MKDALSVAILDFSLRPYGLTTMSEGERAVISSIDDQQL